MQLMAIMSSAGKEIRCRELWTHLVCSKLVGMASLF